MDFVWPYLVVACAERKIQIFDLSQNPSNPVMVSASPQSTGLANIWLTPSLMLLIGRS